MIGVRLLFASTVLALLMLTGFLTNAKAQGVEFGITGGMNISSHANAFKYAEGDIDLNLNSQVVAGYQGGVILRANFSRIVRLQAEPSLIQLGAIYDENFTLRGFNLHTNSKTELLYLQMPLVFQLSTRPRNRTVYGRKTASTTFHLTGGVYGGYLLDARFRGTNTGAPIGVTFEGDFSTDVTSQYDEYDGGIVFGIGFEHGQNSTVGFETRAQYAILDSGNAPELSFEPHNAAVTFSVYLLF